VDGRALSYDQLNQQVARDDLATNQGVVGSNPAGRAKFQVSMACARKFAGFFLLVQFEVFVGLELHKLRAR